MFDRSGGILLHPTSLPGPYGIGDLGPQAYRWIQFLSDAGCKLWQVLPLGPTGYGDSPYQCFSSFAGNPYLISPEILLAEGLLRSQDLEDLPPFPDERVDFGMLIPWKVGLLDLAYERFEVLQPADLVSDFHRFVVGNDVWLSDFTLFMALKDAHDGVSWSEWSPEYRRLTQGSLEASRAKFERDVRRHEFRQFIFFRQWAALRAHAMTLGIRIIGDIPIFVAYDSADVWAHPELFYLDEEGLPTVVAGVPPDYFSPTGQLWGNPLYRWEIHARDGYAWWLDRLRAVLGMVDIVRLDHFRGFAGYWEVPFGHDTAEVGRWVPGPGEDFFTHVEAALGSLPIIAEDLGEITTDVIAMRQRFNLPGMKILQFAFADDSENEFLPHNYPTNCVAYTGTHDNDTTRGWSERVDPSELKFCRHYLDRYGTEIAWDMIREVWASVAVFALAPMQDFLNLDNQARMNYPGKPGGNWVWRMAMDGMTEPLRDRIVELNYLYGRGGRDS